MGTTSQDVRLRPEMTQTYFSSTYAMGAVLGTGFVGVAGYFWLHIAGVLGRSLLSVVSLPSAILFSLVGLMAGGVVFAVGRAWVRVSVRDGVLRIEQRLRSNFECPLEGLKASARLVDSADATPGPVLVRDPGRSSAIRSGLRIVHGMLRSGDGYAPEPASEDFARLELTTADGRERVVFLPGVSAWEQLDDLRASVPLERTDGPYRS